MSVTATCPAKQLAQKSKNSSELDKYLKMFQDSWDYAEQGYHKKWERNWKLYNNLPTTKQIGHVQTFVPMVNSTVNTVVASLFNSVPKVKFLPNFRDQEKDTEVLSELYADFARKDGWEQKNKVNGRQGIITGNMGAYYEWINDKNGGYVHKINVPIRDMIIDPNSHSYEDWSYVGRRYFTSLDSLKTAKIYDREADKYVKRYKNLDQLTNDDGNEKESDKERKEQMMGATTPNDHNLVEILEIWTKKEVVVIAGRKAIIEKRENPHLALEKALFEQRKFEHEEAKRLYDQRLLEWQTMQRFNISQGLETMEEFPEEDPGEFTEEFDEESAGLLPFAHGRMYEDISLPYSSSDVDIIADSQELLNMLTEIGLEANLYTAIPELQIDPTYANLLDNLDHAPGKVWPVPQGAMNWQNPPSVPQAMFTERLNLKDEIRESIAVSQVSKGVTDTDATTATEIKAVLGQSDLRIQEKTHTLANDFFFQEAKIFFKLIQLYASEDIYVRTISDTGVDFQEVNPRAFLGEYTPMVMLDIQKRYEDAEARQANMEAFQIILQDQNNDIIRAKQILYPKIFPNLSQEEIDQIITPPAPTMPEMPETTPEEMLESAELTSAGPTEPSVEEGAPLPQPFGDLVA